MARPGEEKLGLPPQTVGMTRRLLIMALLAVALLAPASALGAPSSSGRLTSSRGHHPRHNRRVGTSKRASVRSRNPVTTAVAIAKRYWGAVPCAGHLKLVANSPLAPGLDPSTDAWVTFDSPQGAENLDAPADTYTNCTITLAHWQWATRTQMERDWGMFCLTITHEMGHLLGHKHSHTPRSVMAPVFTSDANVPAACHATWLTGWRPAGAR